MHEVLYMPRGGEACSLVGVWINVHVSIKTVKLIDILDHQTV
jgi:hypothetical protein